MKYEWKKDEPYMVQRAPKVVTMPKRSCIVIDGQGNPSKSLSFEENIKVAYTLAYTLKMDFKRANLTTSNEMTDYTVLPLECDYELVGDVFNMDFLRYRMMIATPSFVPEGLYGRSFEKAKKRHPELPLERARYEEFEPERRLSTLHIGPYSTVSDALGLLDAFCDKAALERVGRSHRETYLSNPKTVDEPKLKTIVSYVVQT